MLDCAHHHGERAVLLAGLHHGARNLNRGAALVHHGAEDGEHGAFGHRGAQRAVGRGDGVLAVKLEGELAVETCLVGIDISRVDGGKRDGVDAIVAVDARQLRAGRHVDLAVHERNDGAFALGGACKGVTRALDAGVDHGHGRNVGHERSRVLELGAAARHLGVLEVQGRKAVATQALAVDGVLDDERCGLVGHAVATGNAVLKHLVAAPEVGAEHAARAKGGRVGVVVGAVVENVGEVLLAGVGHCVGDVHARAEAAVHRAGHGAGRVCRACRLAVDDQAAVGAGELDMGVLAPHGHGRADAVTVEGVAGRRVVHQAVALAGCLSAVAGGVGIGRAHDDVGRVVGVAGERDGVVADLKRAIDVVDKQGGVLLGNERGGHVGYGAAHDDGVAVLGAEELRDVGGGGAHLLGPGGVGCGARLQKAAHGVEQADAVELAHGLVHGGDGSLALVIGALEHLSDCGDLGLVGVVGRRFHGRAVVVGCCLGELSRGCETIVVLHRPCGLQRVVQAHAGELAGDLGARAEHRRVGVDVGEQVEAGVVARGTRVLHVGHLGIDAVPHAHLQRGAHRVGVGVVGEHRAREVGSVHVIIGEGHLVAHDLEEAVESHGVLEAVHLLAELGEGVAGVGHAAREEPVDGGCVVALDAVVGGRADHAVAADVDRTRRVDGVDGGGVVAPGHVGRVPAELQARAVGQGEGGVSEVLVVHDVDDGGVRVLAGRKVVGDVAEAGDAFQGKGAVCNAGGHTVGNLGLCGVEIDLDRAVKGGGGKTHAVALAVGAEALARDGAVRRLALAGDKDVLLEGEHAGEVDGVGTAHTARAAGTRCATFTGTASLWGATRGGVGERRAGGKRARRKRRANNERATGQVLDHVLPLVLERFFMRSSRSQVVPACRCACARGASHALDSTAGFLSPTIAPLVRNPSAFRIVCKPW